uniref:Transmembrane 9 superfamily member n=1 Tax=Arcella intermedia TaxID=1963864 RepID=A0A6B2L0V5_9EUKA
MCILGATGQGSESHKYSDGEEVILWANRVGPYRNPQETYEYFSLPFCKPAEAIERSETIGEALSGYELVQSPIKIQYKVSTKIETLCEVKNGLTEEEVEQFKNAVENQYWFEFFLDDLPIWGLVGDVSESPEKEFFIWTHKSFLIKFNGDRIIEVTLNQETPFNLKAGKPFSWTYSVKWEVTDLDFEERFDRYLDDKFFEHQIHWFSLFNSFMMLTFLVGLVVIILMRALKKDITRFAKELEDGDGEDVGDEYGWKQVHGDVFKPPAYLTLFSALIGIGTQLLVLTLIVVLLAIGFYHNHPYYRRGTIVTAFIVVYALTSIVSGFVSGSYYCQNGGKNWIKCFIYTAGIFPGVVFSVSFLLNFVAVGYGSLAYIPLSTMTIMLALWIFLALPLTFGGTILGRNLNGKANFPCRNSLITKTIPSKRPYQELYVHVLLGGILPFGSIFIETYFVFTAFWQYKYYYVFGFLLLVYVILLVVTICVTIVSTYFLLNAEDYRWQWTSFLGGASTGLYVYLYAIYYFFKKTRMSGFFQITFYFGYMAMFCFGMGLLTGAMGFLGTQVFVRRIYKMIHVD